MSSPLVELYRAIEENDAAKAIAFARSDIFLMTPEADGVLVGRDAVERYAGDRLGLLRTPAVPLRIEVVTSVSGTNVAGDAGWVFDQVDVHRQDGSVTRVRVTALLAGTGGRPSVAACYWSLPYATQAEQDAVKAAGRLEPGAVLPQGTSGPAGPLATALTNALADPASLPALYSTRPDHASIGSVIDEVFVGPSGKAVWSDFVAVVSSFVLRGPVCGEVVGDDVAWLAANIDIGEPPTPYRFFYVWLREETGWRIVVSHDAVSRPIGSALP